MAAAVRLAGVAAAAVGLPRLHANVEGVYLNRAAGARAYAVFSSVGGQTWVLVGVILMAVGGAGLCAIAVRATRR